MKAFYIYHPEGTEVMRDEFLKKRRSNNQALRQLYYRKKIIKEDLEELLFLLHQANLKELDIIKTHIKEIPDEGVRVELLKRKISVKDKIPAYRQNLITKEVTEETKARDYWIGRGRRLMTERCKKNKMKEEDRIHEWNFSKTIKTSRGAEVWYNKIFFEKDNSNTKTNVSDNNLNL